MKVLYDLTFVGLAYADPNLKTGIHRVIEELAFRLAASPEVDLTFSSRGEPWTPSNVKAYTESIPALQNVPVPLSKRHALWYRLGHMYREQDIRSFTMRDKLELKSLTLATQLLKNSPTKTLSSSLENSDIYHSPAFAIPQETRQHRNLIKFQTFYDLTPITAPDFASEWQIEFVNKIVESLQPDDWVLADSASAKADLCEYSGFSPDRVIVTHLAADSDKFFVCKEEHKIDKVKTKYGIPLNAPYLLSLCTLDPRKNLRHVIESFAGLISSEPSLSELNLVLAGNKGRLSDYIVNFLAELSPQLRNQIITTGYVDDEDLAPLYSGAIAFLYLSFYEGFGLPPLEAMQCGTPVVTSNTSSLPEVVGDAGILLDPSDQDGLAQAMLNLHNDSQLRIELSEKCLRRAELFSWQRCADETISAYKMALSFR